LHGFWERSCFLKKRYISIAYIIPDRFSQRSCAAVNNRLNLILSLYSMVSMTFWKKTYFVIALISAVFLAISLF